MTASAYLSPLYPPSSNILSNFICVTSIDYFSALDLPPLIYPVQLYLCDKICPVYLLEVHPTRRPDIHSLVTPAK